jgi:hypothetical protein
MTDKYRDHLSAMFGIDRTLPLEVHFTPEEREKVESLAEERGMTASEYVRHIVLTMAKYE